MSLTVSQSRLSLDDISLNSELISDAALVSSANAPDTSVTHKHIYIYKKTLKLKSFPSHKGPLGGADLCFNSQTPAEAASPRRQG